VIALTGSSSKLVYRPLPPDDPRQRQPDISKARELLGSDVSVELQDGLAKTNDYFRRVAGGSTR
jgi:UDP-glucuronate decarboxylase